MGKRQFSTVAMRAMRDPELTGLDWRIYAWVSLHDGMSLLKGKGAGCYASNLTLFAEVQCDYAAGCKSLSKLVQRGHLVRERHGRSTRYRVVFEGADNLPTGNISPPGKVASSQDDGAGYVAEPHSQAAENLSEPPRDYSSLSEELDSEESEELNSPKGPHLADAAISAGSLGINLAANRGEGEGTRSGKAGLGREWRLAATLPPNFPTLPPGAQVARFEECFAAFGRDPDRLDSREREAISTWLNETAETYWDQPTGQQAQRLFEEINAW